MDNDTNGGGVAIESTPLFGAWTPVATALPDAPPRHWTANVLIHNTAGDTMVDSYYHGEPGGFWNLHRMGNDWARVTHWMPMPPDPPNVPAHRTPGAETTKD